MVRWILIALIAGWIGFSYHQATEGFIEGQRIKVNLTVSKVSIISNKKVVSFRNLVIPVEEKIELGDQIEAIGVVVNLPDDRYARKWLEIESVNLITPKVSLVKLAHDTRIKLGKLLIEYLPGPEGGLGVGILLGGTEYMSDSQRELYRRVGVSHVVAASGYNVTVVIGWVMLAVNRFASQRVALILGIMGAVVYVYLAGAGAAVARAGIMGILAAVGLLYGRTSTAWWGLLIAALAMLIYNPLFLEDIGFQLSLTATAGLLFFKAKGDFWTSVSAQVATLPLILYHFGNLSPVAPIVNGLILWLVPPIMQLVGLALALGLIIPPVGQAVAFLAWPLLKLFNSVASLFANLPFASLDLQPVSVWWVAGYYLVVIVIYYKMVGAKKIA